MTTPKKAAFRCMINNKDGVLQRQANWFNCSLTTINTTLKHENKSPQKRILQQNEKQIAGAKRLFGQLFCKFFQPLWIIDDESYFLFSHD